MTGEETKRKTRSERRFRGIVHIDEELCKGCGFCVEFCPAQALALSPEFNSKGYHPPIVVDEEACVGSNLCNAMCPDFAIYAIREKIQDDPEESE